MTMCIRFVITTSRHFYNIVERIKYKQYEENVMLCFR